MSKLVLMLEFGACNVGHALFMLRLIGDLVDADMPGVLNLWVALLETLLMLTFRYSFTQTSKLIGNSSFLK